MKRLALLVSLVLAASGAARAQTNEQLKEQLDQALKTIQSLQNRVTALEGKAAPAALPTHPAVAAAPAASAAPADAAASAPEVPAVVVAPGASAESGAPKPEGARLEISGQVMLDAIYDFKRVDPEWNATLRPSTIPVHCPGDAGCGKHGESIFSIRQSKIAFNAFVPTAIGELTTLLSLDLFDAGGGNTHARVLDAWGELGWFGAGQTYTLFMDADAFPNTIDYWGPSGMVFIRNPQLRFTLLNREGLKLAFSLEAPGAAIDTGKISEIDPALGADVTSRTRYPDLVASARFDGDWGHAQVAGVVRQLGYETPTNPNSEPSGTKTGYGINLSGSLNTFGKSRVTGALVAGRGIAGYMNEGGVDLAPDANLQAEVVKTFGWFAYYDHYWSDQWSSSIGFSEHRQDNTDGQLTTALKKASYASVNLLYYPAKNLTTGAELLWGQRENKDDATGSDTRIQFSAKYAF